MLRMPKKFLFFLAFALSAGLLFSGCVPKGGPTEEKQVLRLGLQKNEFKLMNALTRPWYDSANFFNLTHVGLVVYKPDLSIAPCLAERWEIAPDGKSITFYLVKNAKWHDGKPVTAEDVKFSYEYWKKHKLFCQGYRLSTVLDRVEVIDDYTVKLFFKRPAAAQLLLSTIPTLYIIPKHVWEKVEDPRKYDGPDALIGCGPFIFERFDKDAQTAYLKANPDYFGGKTKIDRIEWRYFRTLDSLLLALKKGEIDAQLDYYNNPPPVSVASLVGVKGIELAVVPDVGVPLHLVFGYRQYPTNIKEFREAVSYAIDYQSLVDMIAAGYGEVPGKGYVPPAVPGHNPNLPKLEYNPEKAKQILEAAGFIDRDGDGFREAPDGKKLRIPILPYAKPHIIRAAELISYQLRKVGLDTYVETLSKEMVSKKVWRDRDYYMVVGYATPYGMIATLGGGAYFTDMPGEYGTCKDPELIELMERIRQSRNLEEMCEWASKLQEYIARELPVIALIWGKVVAPYRTDRWEGWVPMVGYGVCNYWTWLNLKPVK